MVFVLMVALPSGSVLWNSGEGNSGDRQYAQWLAYRQGRSVGILDRLISRYGWNWHHRWKQRKHIHLTEQLLKKPDYAFPVVEAVSRDPALYGGILTWPRIREACHSHFLHSDPQRLDAALQRVNVDLGGDWELSFLRSAVHSASTSDLAPLIEELRNFETQEGIPLLRSESLAKFAELYFLSPSELAKVGLRGVTDPTIAPRFDKVLQERGLSLEQITRTLLAEWKSGTFTQLDYPMADLILRSPKTGRAKAELLEWLFLSPDCKSYRDKHLPVVMGILEEMMVSDPSMAKLGLNGLIRGLDKSIDDLPDDGLRVTECVMDFLVEIPDLSAWVDDDSRTDYIWLALRIRRTDTLVQAIRRWPESLKQPAAWAMTFIRSGEFHAAAALIEERPQDTRITCGGREPNDPPLTLADFITIWENLPNASSSLQSHAYIRLLAAEEAMKRFKGPDREVAREEVEKALTDLLKITDAEPAMLEATVSHLVAMETQLFELGRPIFERWRGERTLGEVAQGLYSGTVSLTEVETQIWRDYARQRIPLVEMAGLMDLVASRFAGSLSVEADARLTDLLNVQPGIFFEREQRATKWVSWVVAKMIEVGELKGSVEWLAARMEDYRTQFPNDDDSFIVNEIYQDKLSSAISELPIELSLEWLGYALDGKIAAGIRWSQSLHSSYYAALEDRLPLSAIAKSLERAFGDHPLREWILPDILASLKAMLQSGGPKSDERFQEICAQVQEPWLIELIDAWSADQRSRRIDVDRFKSALKAQPREMQEYLCQRYAAGWSKVRHSSGRELTSDEKLRFSLAIVDSFVDRVIQGRHIGLTYLDSVFGSLLKLAEEHRTDPRVQAQLLRFQQYDPAKAKRGVDPQEVEKLVQWRERIKPYVGASESDQELQVSESLSVTERVWGLVQMGRAEDAIKLMQTHEADLDFSIPPSLKRSEFATAKFQKVVEQLPEGSGLRCYAKIYLDPVRQLRWGAFWGSSLWPLSRGGIQSLESKTTAIAQDFDQAHFESRELEMRILEILSLLPGSAQGMPQKIQSLESKITAIAQDFDQTHTESHEVEMWILEMLSLLPGSIQEMPQKIRSLEEGETTEGWRWRLALIRYSEMVASEGGGAIHTRFVELAQERRDHIDLLIDVVAYSLWKRALLNRPMDEELVKFIEVLALSPGLLNEWLNRPIYADPIHILSSRGSTYLRAIDCALKMVKEPPANKGDMTWADFPGLWEPYQAKPSYSLPFLQCVAAVAAARCEGWDEDSRWKLLAVFQKDPLNPEADATQQTLSLFRNAGTITEQEIIRRIWPFAERYPANGWNFLSAAYFGQKWKDEALMRKGIERAKEYASSNPILIRNLENFERALSAAPPSRPPSRSPGDSGKPVEAGSRSQ